MKCQASTVIPVKYRSVRKEDKSWNKSDMTAFYFLVSGHADNKLSATEKKTVFRST